MPLTGTEELLAQSMFSMVKAQLPELVNSSPQATAQMQKLCTGLANAIIPHLVSNAAVAPGIHTAGSAAAQISISPGNLL